MKKYFYYYDKEIGNYKCRLESKGKCQTIEVEKNLKKINKYNFNKVMFKDNGILLFSNFVQVYIEDYKNFKSLGYTDLLSNIAYDADEQLRIVKERKIKSAIWRLGYLNAVMFLLCGNSYKMTALAAETENNVASDSYEVTNNEYDSNNIPVEYNEFDFNQAIEGNEDIVIKGTIEDTEVNEVSEEESEYEEENVNETYLDYDLTDEKEKQDNAYNGYYDLVDQYANKWGVDSALLMEMLTQESGGMVSNLMQIQFNSVNGQVISAYDFETGCVETIKFSNYSSSDVSRVITQSELNTDAGNIEAAAIILRYAYDQMNGNIIATCLCYNQGVGNMDKILSATSYATGLSKDEILADQTNLSYLDYAYVTGVGDANYVQNVLSWCYNPENPIVFYSYENGTIVENSVIVLPEEAKSLKLQS